MNHRHPLLARAAGALTIALVFCLLATPPAQASTTIFTHTGSVCTVLNPCTEATQFGVLTGINAVLSFHGADTFMGNEGTTAIGVNTGTTVTSSGTNTIYGPLDFADPGPPSSTTPYSCTGSGCVVPSGSSLTGTTVTQGTHYAPSVISAAYTDFTNMSAYWAGLAQCPSMNSFGDCWNTLPAGSLTITTPGDHVYKTTSNLNINSAMTITCGTGCDSTSMVVIDLPSTTITKNVTLVGFNPDQVLFNITGTGTPLKITPANNVALLVQANFFVPNGIYTIGSGNQASLNLDGRVFGGTKNGGSVNLTWNAKDTLDMPTPEPSTWLMMAAGIVALSCFRQRRR